MRNTLAFAIALLFALGTAGMGLAAEKATLAMNHGNATICDIPNCCPGQVKAKEAVSTKKSDTTKKWNLNFWETLQRNGVEVPTNK